MNSNLTRTLLTIGAALLILLPVFLGCTAAADGSFDCSASILPPSLAGLAAIGLLGLGMVIKALDGTGLFSTTSTGFRTVLTGLGMAVMIITVIAGCSTDALTGAITCTAYWLSPETGAALTFVLLGLNHVIKAFDGSTLTKPVAK
jgi:hypothetical protein